MTLKTEHGEMGDTLTRAEILAARGYTLPEPDELDERDDDA